MINLVDPVTPGSVTQAKPANRSLGKEDFLKMLTAQMEYQDPLNPVQGTDFTAQLAQFSSLEQLFDLNEGMKKLNDRESAISNLEALSFTGKRVKVSGDHLLLGQQGTADGGYSLDVLGRVQISIVNAQGKLMRTLKPGLTQPGEHALQWDGLNDDGMRCPAGLYHFKPLALALDGKDKGKQTAVKTYALGTVNGVKLQGTEPMLVVGNAGTGNTEVALSKLTEVYN
ncbi:MAG: flagellar hook assembly protein FlgD [Pseudomonadota bacterium]